MLYLCICLFFVFREFSTIIYLTIIFVPLYLVSFSRITPKLMFNLISLYFDYFSTRFCIFVILSQLLLVQSSEFINIFFVSTIIYDIFFLNDYSFHFEVSKDFNLV